MRYDRLSFVLVQSSESEVSRCTCQDPGSRLCYQSIDLLGHTRARFLEIVHSTSFGCTCRAVSEFCADYQ